MPPAIHTKMPKNRNNHLRSWRFYYTSSFSSFHSPHLVPYPCTSSGHQQVWKRLYGTVKLFFCCVCLVRQSSGLAIQQTVAADLLTHRNPSFHCLGAHHTHVQFCSTRTAETVSARQCSIRVLLHAYWALKRVCVYVTPLRMSVTVCI